VCPRCEPARVGGGSQEDNNNNIEKRKGGRRRRKVQKQDGDFEWYRKYVCKNCTKTNGSGLLYPVGAGAVKCNLCGKVKLQNKKKGNNNKKKKMKKQMKEDAKPSTTP